MSFNVYDYNQLLRHPTDSETLSKILARQGTASSKECTPPSGWDALISLHEDWVDRTIHRSRDMQDAWLQNAGSKIVKKWWGRQGRPLPSLTYLNDTLHQYLAAQCVFDLPFNATGWMIFRNFLRPIANHLMNHPVNPNVSAVIKDWRTVYTSLIKKDKSSTGFRDFTTKSSRDPALLAEALRITGTCPDPEPMVQWYRDMRQKFRSIFAGSPVHLAMFERCLGAILRDALRPNSGIFYHSEVEEAVEINDWVLHSLNKRIVAIECDYESMDIGCSYNLCAKVMDKVIAGLRELGVLISLGDEEMIQSALDWFYRSPIIGIDGRIHLPEGHSRTLSGIGPTNGIENYVNAYVQSMALGATIEEFPHLIARYLLRVMGDDSALLLALEEHSDVVVNFFIGVFEEFSNRVGLRIQREKQGVAYDVYCFCRRYYPLYDTTRDRRATRWKYYSGTSVPIPIYPIEYSLNSLRYPEDPPLFSRESQFLLGSSIEDAKRLFEMFDNCWGDPRSSRALSELLSLRKKDVHLLADEVMMQTRYRSSWRSKVYGEEQWLPQHSPSLQWFLKSLK